MSAFLLKEKQKNSRQAFQRRPHPSPPTGLSSEIQDVPAGNCEKRPKGWTHSDGPNPLRPRRGWPEPEPREARAEALAPGRSTGC